MASFNSTTEPSRQAAAKATRPDVTIVMAGSSPEQAQAPLTSGPSPTLSQTTDARAEATALTPGPSPEYGRGEGNALTPGPSPSGRGETIAVTPGPSPRGRGEFPPLATQAANLFEAVVAFVGDGCGIVDEPEYRRRLEICRTCDGRSGNRCAACGCWINVKARGRVFRCPIGRWQAEGWMKDEG